MPPRTQEIEAAIEVLDRGDKLHPIEVLARSLQRADNLAGIKGRKANLERLQAELAGLPTRNPEDGMSNRDHDALLYGTSR